LASLFPNLNSFHRLLIHRLADAYRIARELDPPNALGQSSFSLVKTAQTAM
jgi:hypothetical protein